MRFKSLSVAALLAALTFLSACSIFPERPRQAQGPWGWGHTERAQQALTQKFGRSYFDAGDYVWSKKKLPEKGSTEVVISLSRQMAYVYHAGDLVGASSVSTGKRGKETPVGRFPIMQKRRDHMSNRYSNSPMPYMQRLTDYGIALHGGSCRAIRRATAASACRSSSPGSSTRSPIWTTWSTSKASARSPKKFGSRAKLR